MSDKTPAIADMTFEAALAELETIVGKLEAGKVSLEDSIAIYERGEKLKDHCDKQLKARKLGLRRSLSKATGLPAVLNHWTWVSLKAHWLSNAQVPCGPSNP